MVNLHPAIRTFADSFIVSNPGQNTFTNIKHKLSESSRIYPLSSRLRRNHDVRNMERSLPEDNIPYGKSEEDSS